MKAVWEKLEKNEGILHIEVEKERFLEALDQAFKKTVRQIQVPGFRKGKVPRHIFEARFGVESLYQDALDVLLPQAYMEALKETGVEPIDQPEIDVEQMEKGKELKFTAKVQIPPEVKLGEYKGIEIPEQDFSVTEEDIETDLKAAQERHAELIVIEDEDEVVAEGDITSIDFEGFIDGVAFEGGKAENHSLEIGSGSFIPGFEEQLIGLKKGTETEIEVPFPDDYHSEELAGKKAVFRVHLHEIKRKNLPELDDEFAKDVSEFETLEEYKSDIEKSLKEKKEQEHQQYRENTVIEKVTENAVVEIPQAMTDHEVEHMIQDFSRNLSMQGMNMEMYFQITGQDEATFREEMKENAEKRVKTTLVLRAIAEAENVTVSEEEVKEELEKMAEMYQRTVDEIRDTLEQNGSLQDIERELANRKTVEWLLEQSKSTTDVA